MLFSYEISNAMGLWEMYREGLSQDILFQDQQINPQVSYGETVFSKALILMAGHLVHIGGQRIENYGLPKPNRNEENSVSKERGKELLYGVKTLENHV